MNRPNLRINFKVVDASEMRDCQADDYWYDSEGVWQFRVVRMGNLLMEILVLIHALVEWSMCEVIGISEPEIKAFDDKFLADQAAGKHPENDEAGDHPDAPYRAQHIAATRAEKVVCRLFGIKWSVYAARFNEI